MNYYTTEVQENEHGELFIELSQQVLEQAGMAEGDTVDWTDNRDGSWTLKKVEPVKPVKPQTELVLVEAVGQFRMRYVVEVPVGKSEWALDTVTANDAVEFSQQHLGETIISHRVVSREQVLAMCDQDNDYCSSWEDELKFKNFVTPYKAD